jgi:hypothetical protein
MRKLLLATLLAAMPACKHPTVHSTDTIEEVPHLASTVQMGDRTTANQLASGFYDVESNRWRWTMQKFAVDLRPPAHSAQNGAVLQLHLSIPPASIQKLGSIVLSAAIGGTALAPETYSKAGEYTYRRDVPANVLIGDTARIDFQLDKAVPPGDVDKRELGVVAVSVGLVAK